MQGTSAPPEVHARNPEHLLACQMRVTVDDSGLCSNFCVTSFYYCYWSLLYHTILHSQTDSLRSHVILHEWIAFYSEFLNIHQSVLTALAWLVPHETAATSVPSVNTIQHAPCHFMQSHICKVHACLAVTCHLHFWQSDRGLLCTN